MYERLLKEAEQQGIYVCEKPLPDKIKGLYADNVIWLNKRIQTSDEKACILAEELGHHHTTAGDILDQTLLTSRKQENRARNWAYQKTVPLSKIVEAHKEGIRNRFELARWLHVTEDFLSDALNWYKEKYGSYVKVGNYTLNLDPLGVIEFIESF